MQMDLCWITVGGQDPLAYFDRYPGRFPRVHVKGILKDHQTQTDVGKGTINWKRIFAQSDKAAFSIITWNTTNRRNRSTVFAPAANISALCGFSLVWRRERHFVPPTTPAKRRDAASWPCEHLVSVADGATAAVP
jgi:hypothetical protein